MLNYIDNQKHLAYEPQQCLAAGSAPGPAQFTDKASPLTDAVYGTARRSNFSRVNISLNIKLHI